MIGAGQLVFWSRRIAVGVMVLSAFVLFTGTRDAFAWLGNPFLEGEADYLYKGAEQQFLPPRQYAFKHAVLGHLSTPEFVDVFAEGGCGGVAGMQFCLSQPARVNRVFLAWPRDPIYPGDSVLIYTGARGENVNTHSTPCNGSHTCLDALGGQTPGGYGGGGAGGFNLDSGKSGAGGGGGTFVFLRNPGGKHLLLVAGGAGGGGGPGVDAAGGMIFGGDGGAAGAAGTKGESPSGFELGGGAGTPPKPPSTQGSQGAPGAAAQCGMSAYGCCPDTSTCYYQEIAASGTATCTQAVPHDYCGGVGITGFPYGVAPASWGGGGGGGGGGYLGGGGGGGGAVVRKTCASPCSDTTMPGGGGGGAGGASFVSPGGVTAEFGGLPPLPVDLDRTDDRLRDGFVIIVFRPVAVPGIDVSPPVFAPTGTGASKASASRACRHGAHVRYRDFLPAKTTFTVLRKQGKAWKRVGRFSRRDRAGKNGFLFTGRVKGRALRPGSYLLQADPRYRHKRSGIVSVGFRIKRC
jgi:hypothetical protein